MEELEATLENEKWDIIGLAEVRRSYEAIQERKSGNVILHSSGIRGNFGTGFFVNKKWAKNIKNFIPISERLALLEIEISGKSIFILQVHAPTTNYSDEVVNIFYNKMSTEIDFIQTKLNRGDTFLLIGDFNASIGQKRKGEDHIMGRNNYGKRNDRGENLVNFAGQHNLKIANTYFEQEKGNKWTWKSPKGKYFEIDYIF